MFSLESNPNEDLIKSGVPWFVPLLILTGIGASIYGGYRWGQGSAKVDEITKAGKELKQTLQYLTNMLPYGVGGGGAGALLGYLLGPEDHKGLSTLVGFLAGTGLGTTFAPSVGKTS